MGKAVTKSRYFSFLLYPDNPYQMQYLNYLENTHEGFYILHHKNADNFNLPLAGFEYVHHDEKPHYHVVVKYRNPRSLDGVLKSIPLVKYYQVCQLENVNEETKKRLFNVYDVSYTDLPVEEIYKPVVEHVEVVSDIYGLAQYLLHKDFKSVVQGKRPYEVRDVKPLFNEVYSYTDLFEQTKQTHNDLLDVVIQIAACADGDKNTFIQLLQMHTDTNVLKYVEKNAYFIDKYVLSPNRMIAKKEYHYE